MKKFSLWASALVVLAVSALSTTAQPLAIPSVASIATLRAGNYPTSPVMMLTAYYAGGTGGGGKLVYDASDTSSSDNSCTIFVDAVGHRFKRKDEIAAKSFSMMQCGAKLDGTTNDYTAVVASLSVASGLSGATITKEFGTAPFPSSTSNPFNMPAGTTIRCTGLGKNATTPDFKLTGTTEKAALFLAQGVSNVAWDNCGFYGNSTSTSASVGGAIQWDGGGAAGPISGFRVTRSWFSNFKQPYWVYGFSGTGTYPMTDVDIGWNTFVSLSGNMVNPSDIHYPSANVCFRGQTASLNAKISSIRVHDNIADGTYLKQFSCYYSGTFDIHQSNNTLNDFGAYMKTQGYSNAGAYASYAYADDSGSIGAAYPTNVWWVNDTITNPYSAGYYTAQANSVHVVTPTITGQSDPDVVLPKGAISFNECNQCTIDSPILLENVYGINASGHLGGTIQINSPVIVSAVNNAIGIYLNPNQSENANHTTLIVNPRIQLTGTTATGIYGVTRSADSLTIGQVFVNGGRIEATDFDIKTYDQTTTGGGVFTGLNISGGLVLSGSPVSDFINHASTSTPLIIHGMTINMASGAAAARGLVVSDTSRININGVFIQNKNSGAGVGLYANNAQGVMPFGAVQFNNVANANQVFSTNFCTAAPSWAYSLGSIIGNCTPSELGTGGSKYVVTGWQNLDGNTTWGELRSLTGN